MQGNLPVSFLEGLEAVTPPGYSAGTRNSTAQAITRRVPILQKVYTKEFKAEAVRLVQTSGKSITQIARELGISDSAIHTWRKELTDHGKEAFPGKGHQTALEEENRRLKRELERVQKERDVLKKGMSIFSREQQ